MSKLIKHKWIKDGFLKWKCIICGCIKQKDPDTYYNASSWRIKLPMFWYFRSGQQLAGLPECKSIFHNDKI